MLSCVGETGARRIQGQVATEAVYENIAHTWSHHRQYLVGWLVC